MSNILKNRFPEIYLQIHPVLNKTVNIEKLTFASNKMIVWFCEKGHTYPCTVNNRIHNRNCPYCSGRKTLTGFNDLETTDYKLAVQVHENSPIKATEVTRFSNKSVLWKCDIHESYIMKISERSAGGGCHYCAGKKIKIGFNDLCSTDPDLSLQVHFSSKIKPTEVTKGSHKILTWVCPNGHIWDATPHQRQNNNCPKCAPVKRKATNLHKYGYEVAAQVPSIALKMAKSSNSSTILNHWETNQELVCIAGYEPKVVQCWNDNKTNFDWQITFSIPDSELIIGGKTYRVDAYLPDEDKYIEIKGRFYDNESRLKWDWFHKAYPNSELWDKPKLQELGIIP